MSRSSSIQTKLSSALAVPYATQDSFCICRFLGELHCLGKRLSFLPKAWAAPPVLRGLLYTMEYAGIGVEEDWSGFRKLFIF